MITMFEKNSTTVQVGDEEMKKKADYYNETMESICKLLDNIPAEDHVEMIKSVRTKFVERASAGRDCKNEEVKLINEESRSMNERVKKYLEEMSNL